MAVTQISNFYDQHFLNHISLDCVVFGFHDNQLKVLLIRRKFTKEWALPGGFVREDESIEIAATRVLQERTGLDNIFLKQFKVFSEPTRSKRNPIVQDLVNSGKNTDLEWFDQRFISVGFYALVDFSKVEPTPDSISDLCDWKNLGEVDSLILDHNQILNKALETLRLQLNYQPLGYNLLSDRFTMPELQKLYETILAKELDRRNFQRKMLSYGILNKLEERKTGGAHKAPYLYEFNLENYQKALQNGLYGGW
jgi:ADP-ribose pyrophosphatase YjhB (NUDIX family)